MRGGGNNYRGGGGNRGPRSGGGGRRGGGGGGRQQQQPQDRSHLPLEQALAITSQDWTALGLDTDPNVAPSDDLELTADRIVSLLVPRIVAISAPKGKYQDLSTTTICRTRLVFSFVLNNDVWIPLCFCLVLFLMIRFFCLHKKSHGWSRGVARTSQWRCG